MLRRKLITITNAIRDVYTITFPTIIGLLLFIKYVPILTAKLLQYHNKAKQQKWKMSLNGYN